MFLASQLSEVSGRFQAHIDEIREFLVKAGLPAPSPEAIPQLASRLGTDLRFRADMASLMRVVLYREREGIGYEDLLGILLAAAAGTKHDVASDSQEADCREMLRFLLQSRRSAFRPDAEEASVEAETREPEQAVAVEPKPLHAPVNSEPRLVGRFAAAAEQDSRDADDVVLPIRTARIADEESELPALFAAQESLEEPWWRVHSSWLVGAVCLLLGVGAGLMIHRGLPFAQKHVAVMTAESSSSAPKTTASIAAKQGGPGRSNAAVARRRPPVMARPANGETNARGVDTAKGSVPAGTAQVSPVADEASAKPAPVLEGRSTPPAVMPEKASAVPMTVVKQVVRASLSEAPDSAEPTDIAPSTAETRTIVQPGSAGIMAANVIYSPPPEYPASATAARVQGEVTVKAVVDPEGKVIYTRVVSGPELLRDAALEAVQRWRYRPMLYYGKPIAVTTTAILDFKFAK